MDWMRIRRSQTVEVWTKTTWDEDPYWDKYKPKVDEYGMANSDWQFAGGTQNNDWY